MRIDALISLHFTCSMKMTSLLVLSCFVCLSTFLVKSQNSTLNDDVLGLIVFKADITDPHGILNSWSEDDINPCGWNGVKCNRFNRTSEVVLDRFCLSGRIGRGLLRLRFLRRLSLADNNITGNLTLDFSHLSNLEVLNVSGNGFSGLIPSDFFSQCGSLKSISLARNNFAGMIPETISSCSTLASINLSGNRFSGMLPLRIWSMPALGSLDLSDNLLGGEIPNGFEGLTNLTMISMRNNKFSGNVPNGIGNCPLLKSIDLSQNKLSGGLPNSMQKLSLCRNLLLGGNELKSIIPEWIGSMRSIEILDLSDNYFTGQIPYSLGNLQSLKILNATKNDLTGILPSWVFGLGLEQVLLSENRLSGTLDDAFDSSTGDSQKKLSVLDLSRNNFSGEIPENIGQLKNLSVLDLSDNQLNGSLPLEIGGLVSLHEFRLIKNSLVGNIPLSIGDCYSLETLYLSHNKITGGVPPSLANISYLQIVDLSFNKLTGNLPKPLSNLANLLVFNISHNQLQGELPLGGFFNTINPSSLIGNPGLCGAQVNSTCGRDRVLPKPIVLNPNDTDPTNPNTINSPSFHRGKKVLSVSALIAIGAAIVIVVGVIFITVLNFRVRASGSRTVVGLNFSGGIGYDDLSHSPSSHGSSGKLVMFSGEPDFATSGPHQALLSKDCEIGRGGFGSVYRAVLGDGHLVAIKKLAVSSLVKTQEDFEREVKKLGKARHHANLVPLDGYYWTSSLQLLIYEFATGGNLYKLLHELGSGQNHLSWNERFNIILGTARGLAHLHRLNIIHYNLKSSNILIDGSGEPKVADYGLAQLLPTLDRHVLSSKIQSALGYVAPEFAFKTVKITEKCDVYGFGTLVLEIVTGKRPIEYMEDDVVVLCDMVRGALEEGRVEECLDGRLGGEFPVEEAIPVMKLGLICTSPVPSSRPDMAEVVNILELIRCPSEDDLGEFSPDF